ncbi:MAG TPA: pyruvate carboxylase subunit B, partial [Dehalococcoidia bacterium]|nr:pyruvate carboxylase subunit B [Dehalococcoidia bacterium]
EKSHENGIDIFRIFDAVNDLRNLETAMRTAKRVGAHVQGTICYTISPVHSVDLFVSQAKQLVQMGADSICIKDMAGLLHPFTAAELVARFKDAVDVPVVLHCHCTSGMAEMTYVKAVEAGVDAIDCAISALAQGTSQPPTESVVATFEGHPRDPGLDLDLLAQIAQYFAEIRPKYARFEGGLKGVDAGVLVHQIPGGMISNLMSQLRELNAIDRLPDVLQEMPRVRKDMGYPPLVTPTSQIVGTQAVMNVLQGERYKVIPREVQAYVQGYYGHPPAPLSEELVAKVLSNGQEPIGGRPADLLPPEWEKARAEAGELAKSDEDVLSYALFPQVAADFLKWRDSGGSETETVAAIVAAMTYHERRTPTPLVSSTNGVGQGSAWRMHGRRLQLRARR